MKSLPRALAFLALGLLSCSKPKPPEPEPPSFDLIANALRDLNEHPDDIGTPGSTVRSQWITRLVDRTAVEDAVYAATGDVYRHYELPEPPWKDLEEGNVYGDYQVELAKRMLLEFGPAAKGLVAKDTAFLRGEISVPSLSELLQKRIDGFKKALLERRPIAIPSGSAAKPVWLLPSGHPVDARQRQAAVEFEKRYPGKAVFATVSRADDPGLFAPLGRRLPGLCLVGDYVMKDVFRLDQFAELILGPVAVTSAGPKRPDLRFFDAHEHAFGKLDAFVHMLDLNRVDCSVVAALPRNTKYGGTHEVNTTLLEQAKAHPGRIVPLVVISPHSADPVAELKEYLAAGAHGVKLINGHGDYFRTDKLEFDIKPMRDLFRFCEEKKVPILWHVNTHLYKYGFLRVLKDFPKLTIVNPHIGGYLSYAPGLVRRLLKDYPNLCLDFSYGTRLLYARRALEDLSAKRDEWRALLAEFPDRFLVGTDMTYNADTSPSHGNLYMEFCRAPFEEERYDFDLISRSGFVDLWDISEHRVGLRGLKLPDELLRKLYWENPRRIYGAP